MNRDYIKSRWIAVPIFILAVFISYKLSSPIETNSSKNGISDNQEIYENDSMGSVKEVFITILPADKNSKKYKNIFNELNEQIDKDIEVKVLFQEGKNGSPKQGYFGYGLTGSNGVMKLRGQSARTAEQKSYNVELIKGAGAWNGYEEINLNKHPFDPVRFRNKLSFDYFKSIPGFTSLRTQFVHLYIKDLSNKKFQQQQFVDYGLFTHVENVDKNFLKNHALDPNGQLYKAENFEFFRYPDKLKLKSEKGYNQKDFEEILEIKGNDNHEKLIQMLEDVNNPFKHINDVINQHFDRENYLTWLAVNILMENVDTSSRNFYLYSPSNSSKWYFLPWDYDKAWGGYSYDKGQWQEGVSNYWGTVLHKRFLKNSNNRKQLTKKVDELAKIFNVEKSREMIEIYKTITTKFLTSKPDIDFRKYSMEEINEEIEMIPVIPKISLRAFYKSLERPMPVHMGKPLKVGIFYDFTWTESYDFQGDGIEYILDISKLPDFSEIIYHKEGIKENECVIDNNLPPGEYYWRLGIRDTKGNTQSAFDVFIDNEKRYYFGIQRFYVN